MNEDLHTPVNAMFRTYRLPIIVTLLMAIGLSLWSLYRWYEIKRTFEYFDRQRAVDTGDVIEGVLKALIQDRTWARKQVEGVVQNVVRNSPVDFIVVDQNGERIIQIGAPPTPFPLPTAEESHLSNGGLVLSRAFQMVPTQGAAATDKQSEKESSTLVIGFKPRGDHPGHARWVKNLWITFSLGLLFIVASCIAWILNIRSARLTEQLKIERTIRGHLEDLGLAAAGLAHETKNPLGIILGIAQRIAASPDTSKENLDMVDQIIDAVDKASARLGNFITYAKPQKIHLANVDRAEVVSKTAAILRPDYDLTGVRLHLNCPSIRILADEERVQQALVNLLLNSLHAAKSGQSVSVRAVIKAETITLIVTDQGDGIPPDLLPHVLKPYVTGRSEGHGLGLSIVKRIIEDHQWRITVTSEPGAGTNVVISGIQPANIGGRTVH